jgi:hypothetical protein
MDKRKKQTGGPSELAKNFDEKIIFTDLRYGDTYSLLEWLQFTANEIEMLADLCDEYDTDFIKGWIFEEKRDEPKIKKIEMYDSISQGISEGLLHDFIVAPWDITRNIENNRESIIKAGFVNSVIYPNFLKALGIVETISITARMYEYLYEEKFYFSICSNVEEVKEWFGNRTDLTGHYFSTPDAVAKYKKNPKITIRDYEQAFGYINALIREVKQRNFSAALRDSLFIIRGYCKLNNKKYNEIQRKIAEQLEEAIVLTENQKKILTYLKNENVAVAQVDIEVGVDLSNKTVGDELRILKKYRFVAHPEGKMRRIGITAKGIEKLNSLK